MACAATSPRAPPYGERGAEYKALHPHPSTALRAGSQSSPVEGEEVTLIAGQSLLPWREKVRMRGSHRLASALQFSHALLDDSGFFQPHNLVVSHVEQRGQHFLGVLAQQRRRIDGHLVGA